MNRDRSRYRSCGRKKRYSSAEQAYWSMLRLIAATGTYFGRLHYYSCPHCDGYHVGRRKLEFDKWL